MTQFRISGKNAWIIIKIKETNIMLSKIDCFEAFDIHGLIEIKSRSYFAKGEISFTLADLYDLYKDLEHSYKNLQGIAHLCSYFPGELEVFIEFMKNGIVVIRGNYQEQYNYNNILNFTIDSDQSYFLETIQELKKILT